MKVENKGDKGNPWHNDSNGEFTTAHGGSVSAETREEIIRQSNFVEEELTTLDDDTRSIIKNGFRNLIEKYPAGIGEIGFKLDMRTTYTVGYNTMALNSFDAFAPDYKNMGNVLGPSFGITLLPDKFMFDAAYSAKELLYRNNSPLARNARKFGPQEAVEAILSHEYAHALSTMYALRKQPELLSFIKQWQSQSMSYEEIESSADVKMFENFHKNNYMLEDEIVSEMANELKIGMDKFWDVVAKEYGRYARHSYLEFFAEAFMCMRHLQDNEKTDFMRSFERIFNRKYKEVFGG